MTNIHIISYLVPHSDEKGSEPSNEIKKGISKELNSVVDQRPQLHNIIQRIVVPLVLNRADGQY